MSADSIYMSTDSILAFSKPPAVTGSLYILPDFCIESRAPKPEQKHLDTMHEMFGWVWKDATA